MKKGISIKLQLLSRLSCLLLMMSIAIAGCTHNGNSNNSAAKKATATLTKGNRLQLIKERGKLICGIDDSLPGFSNKEQDGTYTGMSVDICRALAVALFDDPALVEFRDLNPEERFQAVASGEVDLLSRNTTWTLSRDTSEGLEFAPTTFYDGQGILVKVADNIDMLADLSNKSICVSSMTTTESNLAEQMRKRNIGYTPIAFEDADEMFAAYEQGQCEAATSDRSELVARRMMTSKPIDHKVLDATISKEPLGSTIANNQPEWFDVIKWVTYATIKAEELGINSQNVDSFAQTKNPQIKRFLGQEDSLGKTIGLSNDFAQKIVRQVGNYGEIYDRNIGQPFDLPRGKNALQRDGGLIYAPPFR